MSSYFSVLKTSAAQYFCEILWYIFTGLFDQLNESLLDKSIKILKVPLKSMQKYKMMVALE